MKKVILGVVLTVLVVFSSDKVMAKSAQQNFGLGVLLGAPTAITGKYWLNNEVAIDGGLAFSFSDYVLIYADYLIHYPRPFNLTEKFFTELSFYVGAGGNLVTTTNERTTTDNYLGKKSGSLGLGVRIPFGLEWMPAQPSLGFFAEIVPGISVVPATSVLVQGGFGVRYYF